MSDLWHLNPDLRKDKMTTLGEREESAKESEGGSSPEAAVSTRIRNSLGYEDFDEFAFNFEDYDLWEAIRNHLGYPDGEPTCKYQSSDPTVAAVDQIPQLKCISLPRVCCLHPLRVSLISWVRGGTVCLAICLGTPEELTGVCVSVQGPCTDLCRGAEMLPCLCLAQTALEAAASCCLCLSGCGPCRGQRKSSCSEVFIRIETFPLPSVPQGDNVLLLSVCWNLI